MKVTAFIQNARGRVRQFAAENPAAQWATRLPWHPAFRPVGGTVLAALAGLFLWHSPPSEPWRNASFDYQLLFGRREVTNRVVNIYMDEDAHQAHGQTRGQWSRALHAQLLDRLTADGCDLVVFDVFFELERDEAGDAALEAALRRHGRVVLMAEQTKTESRNLIVMRPVPPLARFVAATGTNWGVAGAEPDKKDGILRQHWPFPSSDSYESLAWRAAKLAGARWGDVEEERWLRFYGEHGAWTPVSYAHAFTQATNFYRGATVFIGNKPPTPAPDNDKDEFNIPYTRWRGEAVAGMDFVVTMFLNLVNGDWLRRPALWLEAVIVLLCGGALGAGLCFVRPWLASALAVFAALGATLGGATLSLATNWWFPWLVVAGGQAPAALAWAWGTRRLRWPVEHSAAPRSRTVPGVPDAPDYELIGPPFGEGHFGKVWLVRNAVGQWQALKAVYRAKFGDDPSPYDTEFKGIQRYKPISDKHPGLLRVDFVSRHESEGYFYYVMELGDSLTPGWENNPALYAPGDLSRRRQQAPDGRLQPLECIRIGAELADALAFLHGIGLTHRDIKPGNVVFVNNRPKLADVGLIGEAKPPEQVTTWAGTVGFMPPSPEPPGTVAADIYGLGMLLYVISTGQRPAVFPALETSLMEGSQTPHFMRLNRVILKACQPEPGNRFPSAAEMRAALREIEAHPRH